MTAPVWTKRIRRRAEPDSSGTLFVTTGILMAFLPLALFGRWSGPCGNDDAGLPPRRTARDRRRPHHHPTSISSGRRHQDLAGDGGRVRRPEQPRLMEAARDRDEQLPRRLLVGVRSAATVPGRRAAATCRAQPVEQDVGAVRGGRGDGEAGQPGAAAGQPDNRTDDQRGPEAVGGATMDDPEAGRGRVRCASATNTRFSADDERRGDELDEAGAASRRRARPARDRPATACPIITEAVAGNVRPPGRPRRDFRVPAICRDREAKVDACCKLLIDKEIHDRCAHIFA